LNTILDLPDSVTAAAIALAVNQSGAVALKTVVLISPEDMDKAGKKAVDYRPLGLDAQGPRPAECAVAECGNYAQ
jgi:hypothetical protein